MIHVGTGQPVQWSDLCPALLAMLKAGADPERVAALLVLCVERFGVRTDA